MSALRLITRALPSRGSTTALLATQRRSLCSTPSLLLKESASSDPNPDDFEKHKQDSIAKQKAGKGHWKPELASVSEESVKADRMTPGEASEAAMKRLQEQTKGNAEETRKHGTSMKDM